MYYNDTAVTGHASLCCIPKMKSLRTVKARFLYRTYAFANNELPGNMKLSNRWYITVYNFITMKQNIIMINTQQQWAISDHTANDNVKDKEVLPKPHGQIKQCWSPFPHPSVKYQLMLRPWI